MIVRLGIELPGAGRQPPSETLSCPPVTFRRGSQSSPCGNVFTQ
ncbi:hypothetical protein MBEBAB_1445 [Brevundimonas abyssalis TAR-001]|uniref:Uncharacterized protein n=1 Tax=Brevundimonas abyssalis TAR-001 TaxID=1391729 RepID=A0A8E0KKY1_9CAUL|nr:hypothetical protein MBEBAB_1445 [Brevundimonas abyssalis TAR-001]